MEKFVRGDGQENAAAGRPPGSWVSRALVWLAKAAAAAIALAIALVVVLLLAMWREHETSITLPSPTGPFAVGRTTFAWINEAEKDDLAPSPASKRQVVAWMWYPASRSARDARAEYLPREWRTALAAHTGLPMRTFFKHDLSRVRAHSLADAPVSSARRRYPVVILRAGGSALTTDFTTLAEDLASHGFFVVGFDAPYRSVVVVLPDGRNVGRPAAYKLGDANLDVADPLIGKLLAMWTSDSRFVVDQLQRLNDGEGRFAGRMDLQRLGMFGHSFGGATALEFCREDSRCKAALDLDGIPFGPVVAEGLAKPLMFLLSDHSAEAGDPASRRVLAEVRSIYDRAPDGRLYFILRKANHFSFSDQIVLNSQIAMRLLPRFGGLDGRRGLAITADVVHTFFGVYLDHAPAASLTMLSSKYPEIRVEGR